MWIYGIIIVLILIIIYQNTKSSAFLEGMWYADPEFCAAAGIKNMYMLVGQGTGYTKHTCYITIGDDSGTTGEHVVLSYLGGMRASVNVSVEGSDIIPESVTMDVDINNGKLILKDDEQIYGIFYKDNASTTHIKTLE